MASTARVTLAAMPRFQNQLMAQSMPRGEPPAAGKPILLNGREIALTASIGIALYPYDGAYGAAAGGVVPTLRAKLRPQASKKERLSFGTEFPGLARARSPRCRFDADQATACAVLCNRQDIHHSLHQEEICVSG
jgi:hypothetical protein